MPEGLSSPAGQLLNFRTSGSHLFYYCTFWSCSPCMELHQQLPPSLPLVRELLLFSRELSHACSQVISSAVVSARKWKRYWKINTSVTRLARRDCLGARSVRCVQGVCVLVRLQYCGFGMGWFLFAAQTPGLLDLLPWISHWVTSASDFHRTGVSSQAKCLKTFQWC